MTIDPALAAVATALSAVAVAFWRSLVQRAEKAEARAEKAETETALWRDRAFKATGLAEIATDVAENGSVKP